MIFMNTGAYSVKVKDVFHSIENDVGVTVVLVHFVDDIVLEQNSSFECLVVCLEILIGY